MKSLWSRKSLILFLLLLLQLGLGIVDYFATHLNQPSRVPELVSATLISLLTASWCYADSLTRPVAVTKVNLWLIVLLTPLGLLVYLLRSRTIGRAAVAFALAIGFFVAMSASYLLGSVIAEMTT